MGAWACNIVGDRRELNAFFEIGHVAKIFGEDKEIFCEVAGRLLFGTPRASRQATIFLALQGKSSGQTTAFWPPQGKSSGHFLRKAIALQSRGCPKKIIIGFPTK